MSDRYIREDLKTMNMASFIDGFTFGEYLHFLNVLLDRPLFSEDAEVCGPHISEDNTPSDIEWFIEFVNLPDDISSVPSFIKDIINGYEAVIGLPVRKFMSMTIYPSKVDGEVRFNVEVAVPAAYEELDFSNPQPVDCSLLASSLKEIDARIQVVGYDSFNYDNIVSIKIEDMYKLCNFLAYENIEVSTLFNVKFRFEPDVCGVKSGYK